MKVKNVTLGEALRKMLRPAGLHYGIVEGTVFVSTPAKVAAEVRRSAAKGRSAEAAGAGLGKKISIEFGNTPLTEALDFLEKQGGLDIVLDPRARRERGTRTVTINVRDMPLRQVLWLVLNQAGLRYSVLGNRVFVSTPAKVAAERERAEAGEVRTKGQLVRSLALERKVTFEFVDTPLSEAIAFLERQAGVKMLLSPRALRERETPVNLKVTDMPLKLALDWLLKLADLEYSVGEDAVYIFAPGEPAVPPAP